ncbi:MAG: hypothetical protein RBG13Loki_2196 [Promethearchaeota archaeon CR_4]|nr:MAG: hypothetical protein RBG13Loki_2196 [Candidatus Lokiarchaeota archaeon CR_4]
MLKPLIIIIRANKTGAYDKLLSDKAKKLVAEHIFDPVWYPYETYKEIFNALCQVEATNNPRVILQWGRVRGREILSTIYKYTLTDDRVKAALFSYTRFHKAVFNFGEIEGTFVSNHEIQTTYRNFDPEWVNFFYLSTGWQEEFFHLCLGKPVNYKILKGPMKGADVTQLSLTWA